MKRAGFILSLFAGAAATAADVDPFAGVAAAPQSVTNAAALSARGWDDNLILRKEVYLLFAAGRDNDDETHDMMSRLSAGFELQKRFATATRTLASVDYQGRIVYREHTLDTAADPMGRDASQWEYETHNAYADFYNLFGEPGRFNLRAGYFYQPFGLNQQTDTHGTLLQLSNDRLFGSDRDWQTTLYGSLTEELDYMVGYLLGSGSDFTMEGQTGMGVARVALNNDWLFDHGLEGGVSYAAGERVDEHALMRSWSVCQATRGDPVISTWRAGVDVRKRIDSNVGPFTLTGETAMGADEEDPLLSGLIQADWLNPGRRWGAAVQAWQFWQDVSDRGEDVTDSRATLALTRYFRNDVGNANLHWIAWAVEQQLRQTDGPEDTLVMLQYYRYS
ncbi:MAG: hypothetical protein WCK89_20640 [bacterium]